MDVTDLLGGRDNCAAAAADIAGQAASAEKKPAGGGDEAAAGPKMSAVDRVRAFRDGKLQFPDITADAEPETQNGDDDGGDEDAELSDRDDGNCGDQAQRRTDAGWRVAAGKWKLWAAVVAVLAVLGWLITAVSSGKPDAQPQSDGGVSQSTSAAPSPSVSNRRFDAPIMPVSAEAPGCADVAGSSEPMTAFSGDKDQAWTCVPANGAPGIVLIITLPYAARVAELTMVRGFEGKDADGKARGPRYGMPASVTAYFDAGKPITARFDGKRKRQSIKPDAPVTTRVIRLAILEIDDASQGEAGGSAAPTTGSPGAGILGNFDQWARGLGGMPAISSPSAGVQGPGAGGGGVFAVSSIQVLGHEAQ